jgi:hypothetical protein
MSISTIMLQTNNVKSTIEFLGDVPQLEIVAVSQHIREVYWPQTTRSYMYNTKTATKYQVMSKKNILDQNGMVHALLQKIDKSDNLLAKFTAYEFPQLTVLQPERPIKFMSI